MTTRTRGLVVAGLHLAIVCSLAAKYSVDRAVRPRVWVRTIAYDPEALIRGRYVSVRLAVDARDPAAFGRVSLAVEGARLVANPDPEGKTSLQAPAGRISDWSVGPVAYFIPPDVPDPTRLKPGDELWAEVTVPRSGLPRPIRLGLKKNGRLQPLTF